MKLKKLRKGKVIEVDGAVVRWQKRRRRALKVQKARRDFLTRALKAFDYDDSKVLEFFEQKRIRPYNKTPNELIKNLAFWAVDKELSKIEQNRLSELVLD